MSFWGCYERLVQSLSQSASGNSRYVYDATNGDERLESVMKITVHTAFGGIFPEPIRPGKKVIRRAEVVLLKK